MSIQTAVVLAAGEGTRLRPLTRNRPKPMLPAANRPILEHVLDALVDTGVEELVLVVGYERDRVQNYFGPSYRDRPITYVRQDKQLGTGHALFEARDAVDGPMLVVNGDTLIDPTIVGDVADRFAEGDVAATLAVLDGPDPQDYGVVDVEAGVVTDLVEKPDADDYRLINAGVYAFEESIFETIEATPRERGELGLTDALDGLIADRRVGAVETDGTWVDATYPWDLVELTREVLADGVPTVPERERGVWVAESARVHETATVQRPAVVGPDSEVGPGAVVGPDVALGRNVTVGANATVTTAVLDDDTRIGPGSTLVDAVTGQHVRVGAGSVVPGGPAEVRVGNEILEGRPLGALLADRVRAVGNVTFAPGTLVGPNARLATGVHASGYVPEDAEVRR
ncbi:bifunctional sugar-1-phosphate nucleotidylyltransferase/acetyltransferase [Halorhabdus amylolytica]|uniref:bifunctional sugar-1-phosphate nucleotidylyltransferase/acetyltransferase n=1 Tax=Halorhabdus amylolytica TaxID=2559573 RepID=UPI0010A9BD69|nr:bifunctional sugar-1-phosphate nucleotidylyltransferase/acetyltransferase [Halorhabdus amylolytica]